MHVPIYVLTGKFNLPLNSLWNLVDSKRILNLEQSLRELKMKVSFAGGGLS